MQSLKGVFRKIPIKSLPSNLPLIFLIKNKYKMKAYEIKITFLIINNLRLLEPRF